MLRYKASGRVPNSYVRGAWRVRQVPREFGKIGETPRKIDRFVTCELPVT